MSAADWRARLARAREVDEVVEISRSFLSCWTSEQLGALPEACRPEPITSGQDVSSYAFTLVQSHCHIEAHSDELDAMSAFFTAASVRLAQLEASPQGARPKLFLTR